MLFINVLIFNRSLSSLILIAVVLQRLSSAVTIAIDTDMIRARAKFKGSAYLAAYSAAHSPITF